MTFLTSSQSLNAHGRTDTHITQLTEFVQTSQQSWFRYFLPKMEAALAYMYEIS